MANANHGAGGSTPIGGDDKLDPKAAGNDVGWNSGGPQDQVKRPAGGSAFRLLDEDFYGNSHRDNPFGLFGKRLDRGFDLGLDIDLSVREPGLNWGNRDYWDPLGDYGSQHGLSNFAQDFRAAIKHLERRASELVRARDGRLDKYFHCFANCEAVQMGPGGVAGAVLASTAREINQIFGDTLKGKALGAVMEDSWGDMRANASGWMRGFSSGDRCRPACYDWLPGQ